jgi:polyhydroxyalkanoate synthesis regulator phasin
MSDTLNAVINSGQPWAIARAEYAFQVKQAVDQGQLSLNEAKEILADLINTDKLNQESDDMQLKSALVFGVTQIASLLA